MVAMETTSTTTMEGVREALMYERKSDEAMDAMVIRFGKRIKDRLDAIDIAAIFNRGGGLQLSVDQVEALLSQIEEP